MERQLKMLSNCVTQLDLNIMQNSSSSGENFGRDLKNRSVKNSKQTQIVEI